MKRNGGSPWSKFGLAAVVVVSAVLSPAFMPAPPATSPAAPAAAQSLSPSPR